MFDDFDMQIQCEEFYDDTYGWYQHELELREMFEMDELNSELRILASDES